MKRVAFVTGSSRGIGKACAIELARAGFDLALTARTVTEGEQREHSSTLKASDTSPLPGSLESTAQLIREAGAEAFSVAADLLDTPSLAAAVDATLGRFGRIDVVVHNGRYIGPGHMDRFLDTPVDLLRTQMEANVFATLEIDRLVLPQMIANGGGTIVNIDSAAGYSDPPGPAGEGGWGMGYGISKAALHRIAGFFQVELAGQGIRCFNVQPGFIATERMAQDMAKFGFDASGAPPAVVGRVVAWLCTDPEADALSGSTIEAQHVCHERRLLPEWEGPTVQVGAVRYDRSGAILEELEAAFAAEHGG